MENGPPGRALAGYLSGKVVRVNAAASEAQDNGKDDHQHGNGRNLVHQAVGAP